MTQEEAENTYGLPAGTEIKGELLKWFRAQLQAMLGTTPTIGAPLPTHFPPLADYDDPMASAMTPILSMYWDAGGKQVLERIGLDPGAWQVVDPHTQAKIQAAALAFCQSTNATTSKQLNVALAELKQELTEGIVQQGDTLKQLRKRVQKVFDHAEKWRAEKIAASEASRAMHSAELESAKESGVVAGFEWLASSDACPLCQKVATEASHVRLGQAFAQVGHNPHYSTVRHPPLHPSCQCSVLEVLKPEYGGPENVPWKTTLDQPKVETEKYEPPEGEKPAEPRPAARPPTERQLREDLAKAPDWSVKRTALKEWIEKRSTKKPVEVLTGGMAKPELMRRFRFEGTNYHYPSSDVDACAETLLAYLSGKPFPRELTRHTKDAYFTSQRNKDDAYWEKAYNSPGFRSAASADHGLLTVYNGKGLPRHGIAHEMAHNFARSRYGDPAPLPGSDFRRIVNSMELPPTVYAKTDPVEDFAESMALYVTAPTDLKARAPQRYDCMKKLIEDPSYAG